MLAHRSGVAALTRRAAPPPSQPSSELPPFPRSGILSFAYQRSATHRHQGIDLPAPEGTPVYATAGGTVTHAATQLAPGFSRYGSHVVVDHGRRWQLYAHLADVAVHAGQRVRAGDLLGTVGRTCYRREDPQALCSSPHLHFEVSPRAYPQDSEAPRVDPVAWLEARNAHPMASRPLRRHRRSSPALWALVPLGALGFAAVRRFG